MEEKPNLWHLNRSVPLSLFIPVIGCVCSLAVLFYRVEVLERKSNDAHVVIERLVRLEVQAEGISKQLDMLLEREK